MKTLFATQIEKKPLGLSKRVHEQLKYTAQKLPEIDLVGRKWSKKNYSGGYTSYGSLSDLHLKFSDFDILKQALDREVNAYTKKLGLTFPRGELQLSALWVNLMPKHCYHAFHRHPNSIVSGTYYVYVPKGTSPFRIEDPRAPMFMASPHRKIQEDIHPKSGEVLLFESWLLHEVPPHMSNETRISVSFNYDWIE